MLNSRQILQARPVLEGHRSQDDRGKQQVRHEPEHRGEHRSDGDRYPCGPASSFEWISRKEVGHDVAAIERDDRHQVERAPAKRCEQADVEQVPHEYRVFDYPGASNSKNDRSEDDAGERPREANEDRLTPAWRLGQPISGEARHPSETDLRCPYRSLRTSGERMPKLVDEDSHHCNDDEGDDQVDPVIEGDKPEEPEGQQERALNVDGKS